MTSTYDHRDHPGRRVRLVPAPDRPATSRARTSSTRRSHATSRSPTAVVTNAHPASASAPPLPRWRGAGAAGRPSSRPTRPRAPAGRPGGDLAAQGVPHPRPPGGAGQPARRGRPKGDPALEPENLNLTPELMSRIPASILRIGVEGETLLEALPRMREAYCGTIAYQIEHLSSHQQRMWLRDMIETGAHRTPLDARREARAAASACSRSSGSSASSRRPTSARRCSRSRASTSVVPMIDALVTLARRGGAEEVVIGMAHRGRLSVLVHNLGRSAESIMAEFEGAKALDQVKAIAAIPALGHRRRQVPPRRRGHLHHRRRRGDQGAHVPEPLAPRVRRPGGHRRRPRRADRALGPAAPPQPACRGPAAAARRRGLPRPGRRRGDAQPAVARAATRPAARSTSSPTTRWASRPTRPRTARPLTPATWPRATTARSST